MGFDLPTNTLDRLCMFEGSGFDLKDFGPILDRGIVELVAKIITDSVYLLDQNLLAGAN
ncbi:MAG: hypothetical protein WCF85_11280 [Rhodospirillaceae bacterium]